MAVDLNSDLGEGTGDDAEALDAQLLGIISSANIACGGHAGDEASMKRVCELAALNGVAIGAHVSYVDREGFGHRQYNVDSETLQEQIQAQLRSLEFAAQAVNSAVTYVKPHGTLYHESIDSAELAETIISAIVRFASSTGRPLAILGLPDSQLLIKAHAAGLTAVNEAFADRAYTSAGKPIPRDQEGALITDPTQALVQINRLLRDDEIMAIDGTRINVHAQSVCVHGDTPGAVTMARRIKAAIESDRVRVSSFAPPPKPELS